MTVRMQDIADQLGLSVSTVSLALRSAPQIADHTKVRVRETAERLGYTHRARNPIPQGLTHVAFLMRMGPTNEFYSGVLSGAEQECRRANVTLHYQRIGEAPLAVMLPAVRSAGVLMVGSLDEATIRQFYPQQPLSVLIDNNPAAVPIDRIVIDNACSIATAVVRLHALGHRRIAYVSGPQTHSSFYERRQGYHATMQALALEPFEIACLSLDVDAIARAIAPAIDPGTGPAFTALLACNDLVAIRVLYLLHERGIDVPGRVSIVGFDDIDMAMVVRPALTTCHVDRELLGALGVRRLIERARQPDQATVTITVATTLVERQSTSNPYQPAH